MAITYGFIDGVLYGTDDINNITGGLVGAGIAPFTAKDSYSVSDLNAMTEAVVGAGVQLEGCKCTVSGIGSPNLKVSVAQGIIFFDSGVRMEVDSEGYDFSIPSNQEGYVFAHFSPSLQKADIFFENEVRDDGETVLLAKILQNGCVEDRREYARSKIGTLGRNIIYKAELEKLQTPVDHEEKYIVMKTVGVDVMRFNYAVLVASGYRGDGGYRYFPDTGYYASFFDLNRNEQDFMLDSTFNEPKKRITQMFFKTSAGYEYSVGIVDGDLCVMCKCSQDHAEDVLEDAYRCTVCLM